MEKYILKSGENFLHFDLGGLVEWHNINPDALCAFDSREEAQEVIDNFELENVTIATEHFSKTFFG